MITDTGKTIIAKYLIGQAPSYASHIAVGCGAKPRKQLQLGIIGMFASQGAAIVTTSVQHDFIVGDNIIIYGTGNENIDGSHIITGIGGSTGSATITNATPAVVTLEGHGFSTGDIVYFTTTGALPTGLSINTRYWVNTPTSSNFKLSTSLANAQAGTSIATSSAGSGTHTVYSGFTFSSSNNVSSSTNMNPTKCFVYLDSSNKETLDFEMFRTPIISKGYVVEDGISNVVFTAELPTDDRYEISEIGIYSAAANPSAGNTDSKILYSFSTQENWEWHQTTSATSIETITKSLDDGNNILTPASPTTGNPLAVFQANSDNTIFTSPDRVARYERGRFLNNSIFIAGNESLINSSLEPVSGNHIHLNGVSLGLDYNVSTDKLKFAFSVVNKTGASPAGNYASFNSPNKIRVLIEFVSNEKAISNVEYARFGIEKTQGIDGVNFITNRYFVEEISLGDLVTNSGFTWNTVTTIKISTTIFALAGDTVGSGDYYLGLDALRLENVSSVNPLYGLTGYSPIQNSDALPVVKQKNTSNFAEFKFGFGSA
jgi:hypothetical protein